MAIFYLTKKINISTFLRFRYSKLRKEMSVFHGNFLSDQEKKYKYISKIKIFETKNLLS